MIQENPKEYDKIQKWERIRGNRVNESERFTENPIKSENITKKTQKSRGLVEFE